MDTLNIPTFIDNLAEINIAPDEVIADLQWLLFECSQRCMSDAVKWASEMLAHCSVHMYDAYERSERTVEIPGNLYEISFDNRHVVFGRSLMACHEVQRATFFFEKSKEVNSLNKFLYYWSRYLSLAQKALENDAEGFEKRGETATDNPAERSEYSEMSELHTLLLKERSLLQIHSKKGEKPPVDTFLEYLIGRVELSIGEIEMALSRFSSCIQIEPRFWPAYEALLQHSRTEKQLKDIIGLFLESNSTHWLQHLYEVFALAKVNQFLESVQASRRLITSGLAAQPSLLVQMAISLHEIHENTEACEQFENVLHIDPYRLDGMEQYSNTLFVTNDRAGLYKLAQRFLGTHRFKWETCVMLGNYYALRSDHTMAIKFFERALRLNPYNSRCWTLIGHEYMELKNHGAACIAYRKASAISPNDPAPYYGLATMYEILKMHVFGHRYYLIAYNLRPMDSRMLIGLGESYLKLNKIDEAKRCFLKAFQVGDMEGAALLALGKIFDKMEDSTKAAQAFQKYFTIYEKVAQEQNLATAAIYLARYFMKEKKYDMCCFYAMQCLDYESTRDEGRNLMSDANRLKMEEQSSSNQQIMGTPSVIDFTGADMMITEEDEGDLSFQDD